MEGLECARRRIIFLGKHIILAILKYLKTSTIMVVEVIGEEADCGGYGDRFVGCSDFFP